MLAVKEAKQLLDNANIDGIDHIYTVNIPKNITDAENQTIVLLTDASTTPTLYGSDDFNALNRNIEVQVFYALDPKYDPEEIDLKLYKAFSHAGWDLGQNHGHTYDPYTNQLTSTFYVSNFEVI